MPFNDDNNAFNFIQSTQRKCILRTDSAIPHILCRPYLQLQWFGQHFALLKVLILMFFSVTVTFCSGAHLTTQQLFRITAQIISSTLAVGNNSVRQSVGKSFLSANRSSGQDQIECSGQTDEMRKTHGAPVNQGDS